MLRPSRFWGHPGVLEVLVDRLWGPLEYGDGRLVGRFSAPGLASLAMGQRRLPFCKSSPRGDGPPPFWRDRKVVFTFKASLRRPFALAECEGVVRASPSKSQLDVRRLSRFAMTFKKPFRQGLPAGVLGSCLVGDLSYHAHRFSWREEMPKSLQDWATSRPSSPLTARTFRSFLAFATHVHGKSFEKRVPTWARFPMKTHAQGTSGSFGGAFRFLVTCWLALGGMAPQGVARSWQVPGEWPLIQEALVASQDGDSIQVASGLHRGPVDFLGKAVHLGSLSGPALTTLYSDSSGALVRFVSGEGPGSVLEGFTLAGGQGTLEGGACGGGLRVENASPLIRGNVIRDSAALFGGGACLLNSGARLEANVFLRNSAELGGGLYLEGGAPRLLANQFLDNQAVGAGYGGALAAEASAAHVEACLFMGNSARLGGALSCRQTGDSALVLLNASMAGNGADFGGALYVHSSTPRVEACILAHGINGAALWCQDAEPVLACNLLFANAGGDAWCGVDEGGNRQEDPLFCNWSQGDLRLQAASPAWVSPCGRVGALGVDCDGVGLGPALRPQGWDLDLQAAPNPFNPSTVLRFHLPRHGTVDLSCHDLLGRLERRLLSGESLGAGEHRVVLEGQGLAAGLHLVQLRTEQGKACVRLIFLP